jgi:nucleotide-binding universal stress UspA family protein
MSAEIIISYDGTENDDDALALGKLLAGGSTPLALAYVRHSPEFDPKREELAQHDASQRLEHGAAQLDSSVTQHVIFSGSTGAGLEELAGAEGASLIVFGSDYRTPPGHAEPGATAQRQLEVGSTPIAVAAAGLRANGTAKIETIAYIGADGDDAPQQTAEAIAAKLGASAVPGAQAPTADLIVVGSQLGAPEGRLALSGSARAALDASRGSVIVLPAGTAPLQF